MKKLIFVLITVVAILTGCGQVTTDSVAIDQPKQEVSTAAPVASKAPEKEATAEDKSKGVSVVVTDAVAYPTEMGNNYPTVAFDLCIKNGGKDTANVHFMAFYMVLTDGTVIEPSVMSAHDDSERKVLSGAETDYTVPFEIENPDMIGTIVYVDQIHEITVKADHSQYAGIHAEGEVAGAPAAEEAYPIVPVEEYEINADGLTLDKDGNVIGDGAPEGEPVVTDDPMADNPEMEGDYTPIGSVKIDFEEPEATE